MQYCALLDFLTLARFSRIPGKKVKLSICAIIAAFQTFASFPVQANSEFINEEDSCREIILAEALVEYPFGWFYTLDKIEQIYEVEY